MLASELGLKYATQNYPSQGTPICKLHGPSIKPRKFLVTFARSVSIIVSWITKMFQLAGYFSEIFAL